MPKAIKHYELFESATTPMYKTLPNFLVIAAGKLHIGKNSKQSEHLNVYGQTNVNMSMVHIELM